MPRARYRRCGGNATIDTAEVQATLAQSVQAVSDNGTGYYFMLVSTSFMLVLLVQLSEVKFNAKVAKHVSVTEITIVNMHLGD